MKVFTIDCQTVMVMLVDRVAKNMNVIANRFVLMRVSLGGLVVTPLSEPLGHD